MHDLFDASDWHLHKLQCFFGARVDTGPAGDTFERLDPGVCFAHRTDWAETNAGLTSNAGVHI
jgi:hypothetical protein